MSSNTIKVLTAISKEFSYRFDTKADFLNLFNRQYDEPKGAMGTARGSSIQVKTPQQLECVKQVALDVKDVVEQTTTLTVNLPYQVPLAFTQAQLTQDLLNPNNMKMFGDDYLDAAVDVMIANIQGDLSEYIKNNTGNTIGTPGTGPNSYQIVTQARAKLNNARAPKSGRFIVCNPDDAAILNNAQNGLFHSGKAIGKNYNMGGLAPSNDFVFVESPDVTSHLNGAGASYAVNGASQTGTSITVKTGTGAVTAGTKITFAGCYEIDPLRKASLGTLKQWVVAADYTGGAGDITIKEGISTSGAYQNCSASPTDSGAMTILGTASKTISQNFAAHRDSYVVGFAKLRDIFGGKGFEIPIITGGAGTGYSQNQVGPQKGCFFKLTMDGDITNMRSVARLDALVGFAPLVPRWSTMIQGATQV